MNNAKIQIILKNNGIRLGVLKSSIISYIFKFGYATATDLDKNLGYSAGRRANDLKNENLLMVQKVENCKGIGTRFYYALSPKVGELLKEYIKS